ncbi:MAG TPA: hypothetical protein VK568_10620 [Thermodesulfobacteriota bacterium]|nr:hypothetical protein [Thermodesulfobacteriota bacterium]
MLWYEGETSLSNLYQDVLDVVSKGFDVFQVNGSGSSLNAVSGPENIREQVDALIRGLVSLQ